jgi:hypothetical protein
MQQKKSCICYLFDISHKTKAPVRDWASGSCSIGLTAVALKKSFQTTKFRYNYNT